MSCAPFTVLIPARLASSRLPNKPLADIAGLPMVVRVARQARSGATRVVVAGDSPAILQACAEHGVQAVLTREDHPSGSDRLAEACTAGPGRRRHRGQRAGRRAPDRPGLIGAVACLLQDRPQASMSTAAHPIETLADYQNPNVVKVVCNAWAWRTTSAAPHSPPPRPDGTAWWQAAQTGASAGLAHCATLASTLPGRFLREFPQLPAPTEQVEALEQLRALWHGHRSPCM
jgi:3-deoxy-manno-octulosonate cytidylyltransferase (CMP-KDO synthetase)